MSERPLDGIVVVDLGQLIAGPSAAMVLAELGADVVKVEPPGGDASRHLRGPAAGDRPSATYAAFNRNKRGICLDLKQPAGRDAAWRLVERADVVIESARPGVMDRLGLGAAACRERVPRLVHVSVTGFGTTGPDRDRGGVDLVVQAESGIMSVTGHRDGPPTKVGFTVVDVAAGDVVAQAVLAALLRRERTGLGATVEVSLLDVALHLQAAPLTEHLATGVVPGRLGNAAPMTAPADLLRTGDGHLVLSAYLDHHWRNLCAVLGRDDLLDDRRFATPSDRVAHRDELVAELEAVLAARSSDHWIVELQQAGLVAGAVRAYDEVVAHDALRPDGAVTAVGSGRGVRLPVRYRDWDPPAPAPAPRIGEHTRRVLLDIARLAGPDVDALVAAGATNEATNPTT